MKTIKLLAFLLLTSLFASAQGTYLNFGATVLDINGNPVANHPVTVVDSTSNPFFPGFTSTYLTNTNGVFVDSAFTAIAGTLYMITSDSCQTYILDTVYTGNTTTLNWFPTFNLCTGGGGGTNCNYTVSAIGPTGASNTYQFNSSYQSNPANPATYAWSFGDGTTSAAASPTHTYTVPGTYTYCLQVNNCPTVCDTIVVNGANNGSLYNISALVLTNNYLNTVPSYPVTVIDSSSGTNPTIAVYNYTTDANGEVHDSIMTLGATGTLWFLAPDSCGFTTIAIGYAPNSPSTLATAGLVLCNNIVSNPPVCNASFIVDTTNSQQGVVILWNSSSLTGGSAFTNVNFIWDFGDGTTSTQQFPSHNYTNPGFYQVCVTMTAQNPATGDSCSSTYCDSLGVDANGNLIYKGAIMGWTLNVLDPNSIGIEENVLDEIKTYPNPTNDVLNIVVPANLEGNTTFELYNINGQSVQRIETSQSDVTLKMNTATLPNGMYILQISNSAQNQQTKIIKQ